MNYLLLIFTTLYCLPALAQTSKHLLPSDSAGESSGGQPFVNPFITFSSDHDRNVDFEKATTDFALPPTGAVLTCVGTQTADISVFTTSIVNGRLSLLELCEGNSKGTPYFDLQKTTSGYLAQGKTENGIMTGYLIRKKPDGRFTIDSVHEANHRIRLDHQALTCMNGNVAK